MKKKKWFILILVLIVIAIVLTIVFINLFKDKNTDKLTNEIHSVATSGYLSDTNEDTKMFEEYLNNISDLENKNLTEADREILKDVDFAMIKNYKSVFAAYRQAIKFFDKQLIFTTYSDGYKANQNEIRNALNDAGKKVKEISEYWANYISDQDLADQNAQESWAARTWVDCKDNVVQILNKTSEVYTRLFVVYKTSLNSDIMSNALTDYVFEYTTKEIEILTKTPADANVGTDLSKILSSYFSDEGAKAIIKYNFDSDMQAKLADVIQNGQTSSSWDNFLNAFAKEGV